MSHPSMVTIIFKGLRRLHGLPGRGNGSTFERLILCAWTLLLAPAKLAVPYFLGDAIWM
jgi:hypothetical protein